MELIEHLEKRWKSLRRSVNVPEFTNGAGDFHIYYTPISAREQKEIGLSGKEDVTEQLWRVLLHKARNENGKPLFQPKNKEAVLDNLEFSVLVRIANTLADFPSFEEAEKN